jgi:hypothetical protein
MKKYRYLALILALSLLLAPVQGVFAQAQNQPILQSNALINIPASQNTVHDPMLAKALKGVSDQEWRSIQSQINTVRSQSGLARTVNSPLTINPFMSYNQSAELRASTPVMNGMLGQSIAVSGDVLVVGCPGISTYTGEAYVFQRDQSVPGGWGQVQVLRASDRQTNDFFGGSVAVSGDVIVVGAHTEDGGSGDPLEYTGAAYVFQRNQGGANNWGQVAILRASDADAYSKFGESVTISGDVIVVGAINANSTKGAAYVFERNQGGVDAWGQTNILQATGGQASDQFGVSIATSGDVIVVGANFGDDAAVDSGAAYVFQRNEGGANQWDQVSMLSASDAKANDKFGGSVAVSGDVIVVGATGNNVTTDRGAAYVFQRQQGGSNAWGQVRKLTASDAQGGDSFGGNVAVSGDVIVVGAANKDAPANNAGAAYVFQRDLVGKDRWGQAQILMASDAQSNDNLGIAVAISGDVIVAGSPGEDGPSDSPSASGAAYVFQRAVNDPWRQTGETHSSEITAYDNFGDTVAIDGDTVVVGARAADHTFTDDGAVYVFQRNQDGTGAWGEIPAILADSDPSENSNFGWQVAISGDVIVVGAIYKDNAADNDGAALVFERDQGGANQWQEVALLAAPSGAADDYFGYDVAVSGDVIVVGAVYRDDAGTSSGAAYVFQRDQGGTDHWGLVKTLLSSDLQAGDNFGRSVAISGDVIVVGAHSEDGGAGDPYANAGAAYVFQRNQGGANNWGQIKRLSAHDIQANARFGTSLGIAGDVIVVGATGYDNFTGRAYVFQRDEGGASNWGWMQTLSPDEIRQNSLFGNSVAVSRDMIVVGAPLHSGPEEALITEAGAAFVFRRNEGGIDIWEMTTTLRASDAQAQDDFGSDVAISRDVMVVGANGEDGGAGDPYATAGAAYIFQSTPLLYSYLPMEIR